MGPPTATLTSGREEQTLFFVGNVVALVVAQRSFTVFCDVGLLVDALASFTASSTVPWPRLAYFNGLREEGSRSLAVGLNFGRGAYCYDCPSPTLSLGFLARPLSSCGRGRLSCATTGDSSSTRPNLARIHVNSEASLVSHVRYIFSGLGPLYAEHTPLNRCQDTVFLFLKFSSQCLQKKGVLCLVLKSLLVHGLLL